HPWVHSKGPIHPSRGFALKEGKHPWSWKLMARLARLSLTPARRSPLQSSKIPIESAAGQTVPYHGVPHIDLKALGKEFKAVHTFVVPDSDYHSSVPLLVGTNVIRASLQQVITIKRHTNLASAVLVDKVVEFPDKKHDEDGKREQCLSLDQVVASGVDPSEAAVENGHHRALLKDLLDKNADTFSQHPMDYSHTTTVQHLIPLVDPRPFRLPNSKIPPSQWQDVRRLLMEMETAGVICPSKRPYASPVVVVTKKDGSPRLCIDYRKLNSCSTRDAFPLPRIEEALEALGRAKYFSTLNLTSGYWQVEAAEQDKHKTAFSTPMGLFEANRMPFGSQNAPPTFQRLMTSCFGDLNFTHLLIYLDDIIIFSKSFNEHLESLQLAFDRLREHGLKLKPSKCQLVRKEVQYLGHLVSVEGIRTGPEKISKVKDWERPTN
ncbi:hypothetical protein M9458_002569, partial [Cirrhinus mrigala]